MVATIRCEEIVNEKFIGFSSDEEWRQLEEVVQHGLIPHFGQILKLLLDKYLSGYDMEAQYFDDGVKTAKRTQLESKLLQLVYPAYESMLSHLRSKTLDDFKEAFDEALQGGKGFAIAVRDCTQSLMSKFDAGCEEAVVEQAKWDCLKVRGEIKRDIGAHVASVRAAKLSELNVKYKGQLNKALVEPVEALLDAASDDTWPLIRKLLKRETELASSGLASALCEFDIDHDKLLLDLGMYARNVVESKAREEVATVLTRMKGRFLTLFAYDPDRKRRIWTGNDNIEEITKNAHSAALKLLSVMAVIHMDDSIQSDNVLDLSSWEKVHPTRTLITHAKCKSLWGQFIAETDIHVTQAMATQDANSRNNNLRRDGWVKTALTVLATGASVTASILNGNP